MEEELTCHSQSLKSLQDIQTKILLSRRIQLAIGCLVMLYMIVNICLKKQYKYPTIKIFMYCCICYFIGMAIVLAHDDYFTYGYQVYDSNDTLIQILSSMKDGGRIIYCGIQAFVNLLFYDLAYFAAVLVTYYINCMKDETHHTLLKDKCKKIIIIIIIMIIVYSVPFLLIFIQNFTNDSYFYSYAPTGLTYKIDNCTATLILYCGINFNQQWCWQALAIFNVYIISFILLVVHIILLCKNRKIYHIIKQDQQKTKGEQLYLIWHKISLAVLLIQLFNFAKLILSIPQGNYIFLIVISYIFDLYPFALLFFYRRYVAKIRSIVNINSLILDNYGNQ